MAGKPGRPKAKPQPQRVSDPIYAELRQERGAALTELAGVVAKAQREFDDLLEAWPR